MKRFRFFWICLAAMIITSFVIPEASATAETSRILIIASGLDEADQPHVIGSFEMPDGRSVWHLASVVSGLGRKQKDWPGPSPTRDQPTRCHAPVTQRSGSSKLRL